MEIFREGRWRILSFCFLGWVCDFYSLILYSFLMPTIGVDLEFSDRDQAWINGLSLAATAIGGFVFGRIGDRSGRQRAFALSVGLYSIGSLLSGFSLGYWSMLFARIVTGLGVGGEWGIGHAIAAESVPLSMRGKASGVLQAGGPAGMALAAAASAFLVPWVGWRYCFVLSSAPMLLALASKHVLPTKPVAAPEPLPLRTIWSPQTRRISAALFLLLTWNMAAFWCTYSFLPKYLQQDQGRSPQFVGWFQIALSTAHLCGNLSFGWIADRVPRPRAFAAYAVFFSLGTLGIAVYSPFLTENMMLLLLCLGVAGMGAGNWSCFGALFADYYPPAIRGTVSSGFYSASRGVQLLTQHAVVSFAAAYSMPSGRAGLFLGALFSLMAALTIPLLPHLPADRKRE